MGGMLDPVGKPPILLNIDEFLNTRDRTTIQRLIRDLQAINVTANPNQAAIRLVNVGRQYGVLTTPQAAHLFSHWFRLNSPLFPGVGQVRRIEQVRCGLEKLAKRTIEDQVKRRRADSWWTCAAPEESTKFYAAVMRNEVQATLLLMTPFPVEIKIAGLVEAFDPNVELCRKKYGGLGRYYEDDWWDERKRVEFPPKIQDDKKKKKS